MDSPGVFADLAAQRACWHPVAFASEIGDRPVHADLLGDPERPVVPRHQVEADGHVLRYEIVRPEAPSSDDFPVFANESAGPPERRSRYELHLPYTIVVESQRPERVPFDLADELHLRFDAVAVSYRKTMRDLGLAASPSSGIPVE